MFEFDNTFIEATATAYQRGLATALCRLTLPPQS